MKQDNKESDTMIKGIYHSAEGMLAGQRHLETVSNNLANASTIGYKKEKISFRQALNNSSFPPYPFLSGEKFVQAQRGGQMMNQQGSLKRTDNPLDVAIVGDGFFAVDTGNGLAYSRDGRFALNGEGELVTLTGYPVLTAGGTLQLQDGDLRISPEGELVLYDNGSKREQILDSLMVVAFNDPSQLTPTRDGLLVTDQEPVALDEPVIRVGYLEESTVDVVSGMVEMIELNRMYEASAKAIHTQDQTLSKAVNDVGRVR
ncbi:hypothetical protein CEE37_08140 [candidate division LCP-89 bacterium B3_LCP]|uniref:Uncharacterized protein n=1 Tax=candidate division LCP-89 bacterium B3_LCP TaxID=2012998 RepID=A0A532UZY3_UNCL8|nr:MAG: hypothetical protein CEE37_08140 [candidate division LCP-89 bacterium B3_LCP]